MVDPFSVVAIARVFSDLTDGEALKSRDLVLMLLECSPAPFSRDHFTPGHITCTGLVLAPHGERVLLVHHRRLDRWLLPGGHVEREDAQIGDAARREVIEETGVALLPNPAPPLCGVDVHGIPAKGPGAVSPASRPAVPLSGGIRGIPGLLRVACRHLLRPGRVRPLRLAGERAPVLRPRERIVF